MIKNILPLVLLVAISMIATDGVIFAPSGEQVAPAAVETIQISDSQGGSSRYPAVAENRDGDRLIIFRGPDDTYWYSYSQIAGVWSAPASIPGQPGLKNFLMADIEADSAGRFHCVWEQ
ncbi:MAG: hypothetical protein NTU60_09780, partial [Candidatus Aminicenantes bacterium]|nr:hypothetical protein [Candidatus Aminicenantes bacterium]